MTAGFLNEAKNPLFNWKNKFMPHDDRFIDGSGDNLTPEVFVGSDVSCKIMFN
jgi:hypothetical protein